ncbi:hypothetical protein LCGC14_0476020 [marine sediment metagenome]|uniref:Uncharacterized protein n=1 Tax=marine sediment metagenome TaxID=412755 RepID=A0A0F9SAT8_9ZZZZ
MSTQNFESLLAEHNADYAQAQAFDNWMPDDGEYVALISDVVTDTFKDDESGKSNPSWRVTGQLLCPDMPAIDKKKFMLGMWRKPTQYGMVKTFAKLLAAPEQVEAVEKSLAEASKVILASQGKVVQIRVTTTKDGEYRRVRVLKVVDTTTGTAGVAGAAAAE